MEWVLKSPQIHSTFSNLGFMHADVYYVNENVNDALESILHNILTEDKHLWAYRRSINFGQNIQKDLIPLLIHAKEDTTIELLVRILVNLSTPIECLLSVEITSQSDFGLHAVFEINNLLTSTKAAFTGRRATKVVVEFLKKNVDLDQQKVTTEQCSNISNSLLLIRNVLHIPEAVTCPPGNNGCGHAVQNRILWNIFSLSIDKTLIKLMTIPEAANWGVTMVQLIALLYKDQHVVTLQKILNIWLETSFSESSEDDESNTSQPGRESEFFLPMSTSHPTSDSSDTGGSGKCNDEPNFENSRWGASFKTNTVQDQPSPPPLPDKNDVHTADNDVSRDEHMKSDSDEKMTLEESQSVTTTNQKPAKGTQIENQELISTSSDDNDVSSKKPVHQKPHNLKQRTNTKTRTVITLQELKLKKIAKRGKANIINVQGLTHKKPTDDDISNVLKEFTVDFLLKGYNSLVTTLHNQILTNQQVEIDISHFFWLVTYFLKFAIQIGVNLKQISSVISFDLVSFLTAEGVNLCEQFELAVKLDGNDLKPSSRRLHLVVTSIREFVQFIEEYKKFSHICADDKKILTTLQIRMCETHELRSLLVLLLRHYNPKYHTKQYLEDLIVTNHKLLTFMDSAMRSTDYTGSTKLADHIKQFATPEIMCQYGLLLEDYAVNGEFINDCVFTIMHHVSGELDSLKCLFQPKILKTFTSILESEFEICDDWSDLIHYVINTFMKNPKLNIANLKVDREIFDDGKLIAEQPPVVAPAKGEIHPASERERKKSVNSSASEFSSIKKWTEDEMSSLRWNYLQCNTLPDAIGELLKGFKENGTTKSRDNVLNKLYKQNIINKDEFEKLSKGEIKTKKSVRDSTQINKEIRDVKNGKLCEQLRQDGKAKYLDWVQQVLLETCYAKLQIEKMHRKELGTPKDLSGNSQFKLLSQAMKDSPVMSPVSYHALLLNRSVPLVPWNGEQASMCKDLKFLQLLHTLGFQMPVDTGELFIRIPHVWSADVLYEVAGRVGVVDPKKLKFSISDMPNRKNTSQLDNAASAVDLAKDVTALISAPDNCYQIHEQKHMPAVVNFMPRPGSSFNSNVGNEAIKRCWLDVVQQQQSQQLKLTCAVGSDQESERPAVKSSPSIILDHSISRRSSAALASDLSVRAPPEDSSVVIEELADNDSISETASVASDLTHMYVSDEDEEEQLAPLPSVLNNPKKEEESSLASDGERGPKRARVYEPSH